jgi:hypothetical protein
MVVEAPPTKEREYYPEAQELRGTASKGLGL